MPAVKFIKGSQTEIEGVLLPYGGPFNGSDLAGERFTKSTDFCLDWFPAERPLLYHHGLDADAGVAVVGRIKSIEVKDDLGGWMQAQLDASSKYYEAIKELIEQGALGLSSGAMAHLVQTTKTGEITRWPLVEGSLTPTPCNPYATVDFPTATKHYKSAGLDLPPRFDIDPIKGLKLYVGPMKGSYEALIESLAEAVNPRGPFAPNCWCSIVATFADHCIVKRCEWSDDDGEETSFWSAPYTLNADGEPVIGTATPLEMQFVAAAEASDEAMPVGLAATHLSRHAAALTQRTKGLAERRASERRELSRSIREGSVKAAESLESSARELRALAVSKSAKADGLKRQAQILELEAALVAAR
jgi:hypothetical protein